MTRDDIIRLARETGCGWTQNGTEPLLIGEKPIERFAELIEQHLIAKGYRKCAQGQRTTQYCSQLETALREEREACIDLGAFYGGPVDLEAAIRARNNHNERK